MIWKIGGNWDKKWNSNQWAPEGPRHARQNRSACAIGTTVSAAQCSTWMGGIPAEGSEWIPWILQLMAFLKWDALKEVCLWMFFAENILFWETCYRANQALVRGRPATYEGGGSFWKKEPEVLVLEGNIWLEGLLPQWRKTGPPRGCAPVTLGFFRVAMCSTRCRQEWASRRGVWGVLGERNAPCTGPGVWKRNTVTNVMFVVVFFYCNYNWLLTKISIYTRQKWLHKKQYSQWKLHKVSHSFCFAKTQEFCLGITRRKIKHHFNKIVLLWFRNRNVLTEMLPFFSVHALVRSFPGCLHRGIPRSNMVSRKSKRTIIMKTMLHWFRKRIHSDIYVYLLLLHLLHYYIIPLLHLFIYLFIYVPSLRSCVHPRGACPEGSLKGSQRPRRGPRGPPVACRSGGGPPAGARTRSGPANPRKDPVQWDRCTRGSAPTVDGDRGDGAESIN